MKVAGEHIFNGTREQVWDMFRDTEVMSAALPGTKSMELVGENKYTGSFSTVNNGELNAFGKSNWSQNDDFEGQLDEIRIWSVSRSGEQIRASMYGKLKGK